VDLKTLLDALKNAHPRTKLVALVALVAVTVAITIGTMLADRPNFVLLYSGIDDASRGGIEKALAGGSIRYKVSQPPGPYNLYVDEPQQYEAQNLVALSGALKEMPRGIDGSIGGASSIFLSSAERAQSMLKRDWQEMESQLESLDFVENATVTSSMPDTSPIRDRKPLTVSVTLSLQNLVELSREQAENVAKLVRFRFGVPAENVIVSDQSGRTLFDPARGQGLANDPASLLEYSQTYDTALADKVNRQLALAYGDKKVLVAVTSEWDHDQRTTVSESLAPKGTLVSEKTTKTESPAGALPSNGGPAGVSSNVPTDSGFGVDNAAIAANPSPASASQLSTSSDVEKNYETARSKTQTVHASPALQAAVGFDSEREDVIQVGTTTFAVETAETADGAQPAAEGGGGLSPVVQMLLQRGIEIAAAIAFLFVLFKTLKGAKAGAQPLAAGAGAGGGGTNHVDAGEPDPEMLARARVEELVRTDPRRVGEILSRWAGESRAAARSGK
jgi:flagellar biosynthesis/type III secretory pathway M-ring protein FliF/YscJ